MNDIWKCADCGAEVGEHDTTCSKWGADVSEIDGDNKLQAKKIQPPQDTLSKKQVRPWVRYWARWLDEMYFQIVIGFVMVLIPDQHLKIKSPIYGPVATFLYTFIEAFMLCSWGKTPGKALLRIRLRRDDGAKLTYSQALARALQVWVRGAGLGIPIVALFAQFAAYKRLTREGKTSWDSRGNYIVTHQIIGPLRATIAIIIIVLISLSVFYSVFGHRLGI